MEPSTSGLNGDRLDSWKEVAKYLGRDVRTVRRWERERPPPVHRMPGGEYAAIYALRSEIDGWLGEGRQDAQSAAPPAHSTPATGWAGCRNRIIAGVVLAAAASVAAWLVAKSLRPRPEVIAVNFFGGQGKPLSFHLDGLGFGNPTFRLPANPNFALL